MKLYEERADSRRSNVWSLSDILQDLLIKGNRPVSIVLKFYYRVSLSYTEYYLSDL